MCLTRKLLVAVAITLSLAASNVSAGDNTWDVDVIPYVWALGFDGDAALGDFDADVDVGFDQILENLDMAGQLHVQARRNRWLFFGDIVYGDVSMDDALDTKSLGPFSIGPLSIGPIPLNSDIDLDLQMLYVEAGIGYALLDADPSDSWAVDVYGGIRYTDLDAEITFNGVNRKVSQSIDWTEPFIGMMLRRDIAPDWRMIAKADVGGFGNESDSAWSAHLLFSYNWREQVRLVLGYKALHQDYTEGNGAKRVTWDVTTHGPLVGVDFRF